MSTRTSIHTPKPASLSEIGEPIFEEQAVGGLVTRMGGGTLGTVDTTLDTVIGTEDTVS